MKKFCKFLQIVVAPALFVLAGVSLAGCLFLDINICLLSFLGLLLAGMVTGLLFSDPDLYEQ